jgi:hypothetical protein
MSIYDIVLDSIMWFTRAYLGGLGPRPCWKKESKEAWGRMEIVMRTMRKKRMRIVIVTMRRRGGSRLSPLLPCRLRSQEQGVLPLVARMGSSMVVVMAVVGRQALTANNPTPAAVALDHRPPQSALQWLVSRPGWT